MTVSELTAKDLSPRAKRVAVDHFLRELNAMKEPEREACLAIIEALGDMAPDRALRALAAAKIIADTDPRSRIAANVLRA